jgi:hypothetical protein
MRIMIFLFGEGSLSLQKLFVFCSKALTFEWHEPTRVSNGSFSPWCKSKRISPCLRVSVVDVQL